MPKYISSATTTVSSASVEILASTAAPGIYEVAPLGADIWINHKGGTASGSGADCIPVGDKGGTEIVLGTGHGGLTAIRDASTDAEVTVSELAG